MPGNVIRLAAVAVLAVCLGWLAYEHAGFLASALSATLFAGFGFGFCCCTSDTTSCIGCTGDLGPAEIEVVIAGVTETGCGSCLSFNNTFILTAIGCQWALPISEACTIDQIHFSFNATVIAEGKLQDLSGATEPVIWREIPPTDVDCLNWSSYLIPILSLYLLPGCGGTPTFRVTAL